VVEVIEANGRVTRVVVVDVKVQGVSGLKTDRGLYRLWSPRVEGNRSR
jgi:hypothetical protein